MKMLLSLAIVLAAILIAIPFLWYRRRRIDESVNRWTRENDCELIRYEERTFGPFMLLLKKTRNQAIVWIEIKERSGNLKKGWLVTGSSICKWVE